MSHDINNDNMSTPPPWDGIEVPDGWMLDETGVYRLETDWDGSQFWSNTRLFAPVWVEGRVFNQGSQEWGRTVAFFDHDGNVQRLTISDGRFFEESSGLAREFVTSGLYVARCPSVSLVSYLYDFDPGHRTSTESDAG